MGLKEILNTKVDFIIKSDGNEIKAFVAPAGYIFQPRIEVAKEVKKFIDVKDVKLLE